MSFCLNEMEKIKRGGLAGHAYHSTTFGLSLVYKNDLISKKQ